MGVVIGAYRTVEQLESSSRPGTGDCWLGRDDRSGLAVAMTVLSVDHLDAVEAALGSLPDVLDPHLLQVDDIVHDETSLALISRWPPGGTLTGLLMRRQRLTAAETLTVLIPIAAALAQVHEAGTRHGDVAPSTVWFDTAGRPLLGAVGVAHAHAVAAGGLPVGIGDVAPEVVRGERRPGGSVTTAADVFSLGSVALRCLAGRPAWPADDPADVLVQAAAGLWPDLPDDTGPPALLALVRAMLRADPTQRPTAREVVDRLAAVGQPEPVGFGPLPATESPSRWNGWGAADPPEKVDTGPSSGEGALDRRTSAKAAELPADPLPRRRRNSPSTVRGWRSARTRRAEGRQAGARVGGAMAGTDAAAPSRVARAGIAVLVGLLVAVVAVQIGLWWTGRDQPVQALATAPVGEEPAEGWLQVVADLDAARARALATADAALLGEVYLPQSAPALADVGTIEQLAARRWTIRDAVHEISSVTVAAAPEPSLPDSAAGSTSTAVRLLVRDSLPAKKILDGAGQQVGQTAARGEQGRIMTLTLTSDGYRISAVELA